ncbi:TetR/AcrR family transcriptional regulator [Janthinobacterium sp. PLB04]|uniref:TetR/AcrR family transcriptional regulator n=1 Tax=Janthinobacterium lividum TaxID=29581 RepID=A0AAJ4T7D4_9BURK|nr:MULTISPECIES: TetR/AcrR family transcriptional regulator [Janthinobacterium]KAB0324411.1 TetR/AcrR family transcriptional regulator [Janthinobacterium lividum]QSX98511.1 TetR/AcrR family transcriptional regulator [Janthinobacterium lividum]UGQ38471.1 TetR/AcrR family transcriptional regulator [Janthinobacterium sp. PLB04]
MRYPAEETAEKHQRILTQAARLFREKGYDGVSVGQIMQATGLTHGPFYNHFASKEALMAESTLHGSEHSRVALDAATASPEAMRQYVRDYVSAAHRDAPGDGCLLAALAGDARKQPAVRPAFTVHLKTIIGKLATHFPWQKKRNRQQEAIVMLSAMVGAVALARAVDDAALSDDILAAVSATFAPPTSAPPA